MQYENAFSQRHIIKKKMIYEFQFQSRAFFELSSSPAKMRIENIQKYAAGIYRCRVDFLLPQGTP